MQDGPNLNLSNQVIFLVSFKPLLLMCVYVCVERNTQRQRNTLVAHTTVELAIVVTHGTMSQACSHRRTHEYVNSCLFASKDARKDPLSMGDPPSFAGLLTHIHTETLVNFTFHWSFGRWFVVHS